MNKIKYWFKLNALTSNIDNFMTFSIFPLHLYNVNTIRIRDYNCSISTNCPCSYHILRIGGVKSPGLKINTFEINT